MMSTEQAGLFLFQKAKCTDTNLKEMLQFIRSHAPGKTLQFAYVESETSLIPHLTLWENLHVVVGGSNWKEFTAQLEVDWQPLVNLVRDPNKVASEATCWDRLTVSLIKATLIKTQHILIDINEDLHSPLNLMNLKKMLTVLSKQKNVYLASANPSHWLDSSHSLVKREGYEFKIESLILEETKGRTA